MRISATKPDFDKVDWDSLGIEDENTLKDIRSVLEKPAQINSYMLELYQLGLKQKQIGKIFGCSESAVSLRLAGKSGSGEGVARKNVDQLETYIQSKEAREECPHSEFLEDTLLKFRISPRKTQDIVSLYTESFPLYDKPKDFLDLLRANRVSEKKAFLIMKRFYMEDIIPDSIDLENFPHY
jgi:hypothetical protein